jgi:NTP pyrophosphatase (non-canonical NTP hydrolase)
VTFDEYQKGVRRTARAGDLPTEMSNCVFGLVSELGEIAEPLKHFIFHGHPLTEEKRQELKLELGDLLYYTAWLADVLAFNLEEIAHANARKLERRYPTGFESERSINRGG